MTREMTGSPGALAEARLVEQIAEGSERALGRLYDRYSRILYSMIVGVLRDPRDAEEVLQEVFLQVWRLAGRFDLQRGNAYRWLVTLTRSRAIDRLRSKNFTRRRDTERSLDLFEPTLDSDEPSQLDAVLMLERAEVVRRGLGEIPPEQLQVMQLAYFQGYTQSEIARELGIPLGTVKSRMRQGLLGLRHRLAGESTR